MKSERSNPRASKSELVQKAEDGLCVRIFLSVDLVGSTAFKGAAQRGAETRHGPPWLNVFEEFYSSFAAEFEQEKLLGNDSLKPRLCPKLVKTIGDELLLQTPITSCDDASQVVQALEQVIVRYKANRLRNVNLLLKGACWIAGFPINNSKVRLRVAGRAEDIVFVEDFVGPSIDTGFRIAKLANPQKLIVSVDLALLVVSATAPLQIYFDGTESLKGVLGGKPYPILWYQVRGQDFELHKSEMNLRRQVRDDNLVRDYCFKYLTALDGEWLHVPYFSKGSDPKFSTIPESHKRILEERRKTDAWLEDMGPKEVWNNPRTRK